MTTAEDGERRGSSDVWWKTVPQTSDQMIVVIIILTHPSVNGCHHCHDWLLLCVYASNGWPTYRLFSYVDHDSFTSRDEVIMQSVSLSVWTSWLIVLLCLLVCLS